MVEYTTETSHPMICSQCRMEILVFPLFALRQNLSSAAFRS